jgi:hypothetical protein
MMDLVIRSQLSQLVKAAEAGGVEVQVQVSISKEVADVVASLTEQGMVAGDRETGKRGRER